MNADGTGQRRLTWKTGGDPAWSPDAHKIAFASARDRSRHPAIFVMNANGTNQTRLTP